MSGLNRRDAIMAMSAVVGIELPFRGCRAAQSATRLDRIGLQLYTVRAAMRDSVEATLERVAAIGYQEVEFAGYFNRPPPQIRDALAQTGLKAPGTHVPLAALREQPDRTLEMAAAIGHRYVIVAWLDESERNSMDAIRSTAEVFNRFGDLARQSGLAFAYHNHDVDFARVDGRVIYDVLLEETDPALVQLELDLFWMRKGGGDPLEYFKRFPHRFPAVHIKDMDRHGAMADLGQGTIDFRRIFAARELGGIQHYFAEHDEPADPLAFARAGYEYLARLEF